MRCLVQRVLEASVHIDQQLHSSINKGLLLLCGFEEKDGPEDLEWIARKVLKLRIFSDDRGQMNGSLDDVGGELLVVSQFTLFASTQKGNRPSFIQAARPEQAIPLYNSFLSMLQKDSNKEVRSGVFGADMKVSLINDGPVTIWMDSKNRE